MTFMDDTERDWELAARNATRTLQLWLATLAPVDGQLSIDTREKLREVIYEMKWPYEFDEQLSDFIVKEVPCEKE